MINGYRLAGWCWSIFGWWNWYVSFVYSVRLLCFPNLIQMSRNNEFILKSYKIVLAYHILKKKIKMSCHFFWINLLIVLTNIGPKDSYPVENFALILNISSVSLCTVNLFLCPEVTTLSLAFLPSGCTRYITPDSHCLAS